MCYNSHPQEWKTNFASYSFDLVPRLRENLSCPVLQDTLKENNIKIFMKVNFFKRCLLVGHLLATVL
jgi:hypothetical protein